jgi:nucleotide-binding universal stress UspA family protein
MQDLDAASSVVVGVDGSQAANRAALWAVDEAVSRDIPLRLVYVIDTTDLSSAGPDHSHLASARAALYDTQRTVEAAAQPVKIESEILWGEPLAKLREQSRSATMICIGSIGKTHACHGDGSVARALPGLARCPVAVMVRQPSGGLASPDAGSIVVEAENDVVLQHAFEEANLRRAPLRAIALWRGESADDIVDGNRLVQAQLDRRIIRWQRFYPDVTVEAIAVHGDLCTYLAALGESVQLLVTGVKGQRRHLGTQERVKCSVLTVRGNHL